MSEKGHIIAIGGGGFGRNPNHRKSEKHEKIEFFCACCVHTQIFF